MEAVGPDWKAELRRTGILLTRDPGDPQALLTRGIAAYNLSDWAHAVICLEKARQRVGDVPVVLYNLTRALLMARQIEAAVECARRLVTVAPSDPEHLALLGTALLAAREVEEALPVLQRCGIMAKHTDPCFEGNLYHQATALLCLGRWREGWYYYEARWRFADAISLNLRNSLSSLPGWIPEEHVDADLVVGAEQGSGDIIMISRFLPELTRMARSVTVIVPDRLLALLSAGFATVPNLRFKTLAELRLADHSHYLMSMSIPCILEVEPGTLSGAPYLTARPWADGFRRSTDRLAVGISWLGSPLHADNQLRSLPSHLAAAFMAQFPEVDFYAIAPASQIPASGMPTNLHRPLQDRDGFEQSAGLISAMDLMISVDSAAAHLAGALGVPVWTLLHARGDWRWGLGKGEHTVWYDSMRLLRQERPGDWSGPLDQLAQMLRAVRT